MKFSPYLKFTLLLLTSHTLWAEPVILTGKTVRFIIEDEQLTAFGSISPTVQNDTLIFSAPSANYFAEALAPQAIKTKSQYVEFKIEALSGYRLTMLTMHSSGLRSEEGTPILTNTFAYGTLNAKDQFLINHYLKFEAEDASTGSWQAVNISSPAQGSIATLNNLKTRTLDIALSHNIRALALDMTGTATIDAQDGIGFKVSTSAAEQYNRVFDWAESTFNLMWGTATLTLATPPTRPCSQVDNSCVDLDGMHYRCYPSARLCIGSKAGTAYTYQYDENSIHNVGALQPYLEQAEREGF